MGNRCRMCSVFFIMGMARSQGFEGSKNRGDETLGMGWKAFPFLCLGAMTCLCLFGVDRGRADGSEESPRAVKQTSERTVTTDVETQKAVDAWAGEEKALLEKIDRLEQELRRVDWEQKKTSEYLEGLENKMTELQQKAEEMKRIRAELLPILDQGLERLNSFVEEDMPFDRDRRLKRLDDAALVLNDYDAGLLVKSQAFLDALARETDFGYSVDIQETDLEMEGRSIQVKLLRVGRIGLFALGLDGKKAYVWDVDKQAYLPLDRGIRDLEGAFQIVERLRIIELTRLPMGRPLKVPVAGGRTHE